MRISYYDSGKLNTKVVPSKKKNSTEFLRPIYPILFYY